jgi:hypothetical protein|tara:strand:- start:382 stop:849 length:468 start_codon:yes stop_codon:yes gene_type:complete
MAKKKRTHKWVAATIILVILVEFDIGDTIFALYLLGYCIYSIYLPVSWSFGRKKSEKGGEQIVDSTQTKEIKQSTKKKVASKLQYDGNEVILFSYSLVNESSPIYQMKGSRVIESSKTDLKTMYNNGWRISDLDKTGKSAQLDAFNFVIRMERIS